MHHRPQSVNGCNGAILGVETSIPYTCISLLAPLEPVISDLAGHNVNIKTNQSIAVQGYNTRSESTSFVLSTTVLIICLIRPYTIAIVVVHH